jgi:hypothetical protein
MPTGMRATAFVCFLCCVVCAGCQQSASSAVRPEQPRQPRTVTAPPSQGDHLIGGGESLLGGPTHTELVPSVMGAPVGR